MIFDFVRRAVQHRLEQAMQRGEDILERFARAEVDAFIHAKLQTILIPAFVVGALLVAAQAAGAWLGGGEASRLTSSSIALAAALYGAYSMARGLRAALPILALWLGTVWSPWALARLMLYERILASFNKLFSQGDGQLTTIGSLALQALKFAGPQSWEALAFRLANRLAPALVNHAALRGLLVLGPALAATTYYRMLIFPAIIRGETGVGPWAALVYPLAAAVDAIAGTHLREALRGGP
jgi:hypothetical protein